MRLFVLARKVLMYLRASKAEWDDALI